MKKVALLFGVGSCCFILLTLLVSTGVYAQQKPFHLRMQTLHTEAEAIDMGKVFAAKINRATNGRVVVEIFPSGALVPTPQMAQAVGAGTIEMAFSYGGYYPGFVDIANIECGVPMAWGNIDEAVRFHFVKGFMDIAREAYAEKGIYWITPVLEEPFLLNTKKPVRNLNDLKPMKIRATAPVAALLKQFGIATVYFPSEEFYTSLATGIVDGVIYGSETSYAGLKLQEQAKYITDMKILNPMTSAILINKKLWDSMPEDLRKIVEDTAIGHYTVPWFVSRSMLAERDRKYFTLEPFSAEDVGKLTKAATTVVWEAEAKKSPRAAKAIEMLKAVAKETGRL
jgi:TRAP-type C4-dicarboxylate transport system substrate-binding protein